MAKSTGRLILLVAIVGLIVGLFAVQFFLPISGATVQLEEAGLIGALIAGFPASSATISERIDHERKEAHHPLRRRDGH